MAGLPGICWDLPGLVTLASFLLTDEGCPLKGESAGIDLSGLMTELSSTFTRSKAQTSVSCESAWHCASRVKW
jgi:hypothetical protein